ncbi:penicillin-binding protein activator [Roseivivax sediminis]|uniref:ABC-type branched-chain amino acid transport system, substrate-binding protein n=1 Tax=Roseivivax sediminis TaxID=936889 RepID=A0A1I1W878_9RHOB|nr:penicillin-binding protein activator [Roseivivax sediminis]SFD89210.1 ABC-type branched-chain amino acid transport system, substrate-binding protein [Roseivivax sediminis]
MIARFAPARKACRRVAAALALTALAACDAALLPSSGPGLRSGEPVPVALLLPQSDASAGPLARNLENAARLAMADLDGVEIDLRVYDTGGNAQTAAQQAQRAVDEGAGIILGPLRSDAANAAAVQVADEGVNVLAFSNNTQVAGGNLFLLGATFENSANRVVSYAADQGTDDLAVLYTNNVPGQVGRNAVQSAAARNGARVVAAESYDLNSESLSSAMGRVQPLVESGQADGLVLTDDWQAGLSVALQLGPEQGLTPSAVQYMGITRWDARPDGFSLPGIQGAWFTMPSQSASQAFESRYQAAYGSAPAPLAGLAFDGIAAIGALAGGGRSDALSARSLTQNSGFQGATGVFRLRSDGTNERGLAVATVRNQQVVILDPAPRGFGGAGF